MPRYENNTFHGLGVAEPSSYVNSYNQAAACIIPCRGMRVAEPSSYVDSYNRAAA